MKEIRMFGAVKPIPNKQLAWLYAVATIFLLVFFLYLGNFLGGLVVWNLFFALPSDVFQIIMFAIDPLFMDLLIFLFPAGLVCLWVLAVERRSPIGLGFYKEKAWLELLKGGLIGFLLIGAVVGLQVLTGSIHLSYFDFSFENILNLILILPFWFIQSGTEELLTRGWLFPVVSKNTRIWIGTAVSSLLFAILHLQNPSVNWISLLNIALFGLLACLYVLKTDNIWGISAIHAAWNCFQGSFFGLSVSGLSTAYAPMRFENGDVPDFMSGGGFGPEGSLFSSLVMGVYILYLAWDLYQKKQSQA
ncbi:CPBP family intramembrane glutamic endopeptidase [Streptococcus sp.]|jgi:membrane protease YdiL (CAAX protease family)|uniref:CPBP family intramembrane glutamic endopeptidase n=1 Tax=Streptococcus sp. TaxID=1306 RepID=UPI00391A3C8B